MKVTAKSDRTHNPFDETYRVSCLRENLTSSSKGEGLETGLRSTLNGHTGGNPGDSQGQSYGVPRQSFTRQSLFAALKKRGFRFEDTHLTDPRRISRLIALLAIAFAWAHHTGEVLSHQQPIPFKKLSVDPSRLSSVMASTSSATSCSTFRTSLNSSTGC
jgi:hypothetical protein